MPIAMDDLERRLAAAGRPLLGCGDAALVVGCGPRWALKLGFDGDDAWPAWARWCRANPSPHVPVIAALQVLEHEGRQVAFLAIVERLHPTLVAARWLKGDRMMKRDPLRIAAIAEPTHPGVAALLRAASVAFPNARWDAAPSNWMERDDGTLVLTDPLTRPPEALARAA